MNTQTTDNIALIVKELTNSIDAYQCPRCGKVYENEKAAESCLGEVWQCPRCDEWHKTKEDAIFCCPTITKLDDHTFKCDECGDCHETEEEAAYCCPPTIEQSEPKDITAYKCPSCNLLHDNLESATDCCLWKLIPIYERNTLKEMCGCAHHDTKTHQLF